MAQNKMRLWYTSPAPRSGMYTEPYPNPEHRVWEKWSLPLGNGYLGACIFGFEDRERIQITENSLANPFMKTKTSAFPFPRSYGLDNFGELYIDFGHGNVTEYVRELSLDDACAKVSYTYEGVRYTREYFASHPDKVLVMKFSADKAGAISLYASADIPFLGDYCLEEGDGCGKHGIVTAQDDTVTFTGVAEYYHTQFEGQLKVIPSGGTLRVKGNRVYVDDADEVVMLFACGTNYRLESRVFTEADPKKKLAPYAHPHDRITGYIAKAAQKSYEDLLRAHLADYRSLFDRVKLDLNTVEPGIPTDQLLNAYKAGTESRYLETLLYQYGRYLLICSSRPGCLPANLQGIWNCYKSAPWSGGYWHNINVQMNYWPSGIANLSELFLPYVDYSRCYLPLARQHADNFIRKYYPDRLTEPGTNGWIIGTGAWPHDVSGIQQLVHSGPGTGAFTSLMFWDYYDYTRDTDFLRQVCYPMLREMSVFFSKLLIEVDGKYLVEHSASPENMQDGKHYHTVGCAFDQQMVYENYKRTLEAAQILGIQEPLIDTIRQQLDHLDPVLVGESGQVKEYREERFYGDIGEYTHRHISQLVGLYPGTVINANTPQWLAAAAVTLTERGDESTGWAAAHRLCLWTRAKNGKKSMDLIRSMLRKNILPNLWDTHPPFQIDGNFGYTAGVSEMLLQSQAGFIELLQSLPDEWAEGSFSGLVARGNFVVDCRWKNKKALSLRIQSRSGGKLTVWEPRMGQASFIRNGEVFTPVLEKSDFLTVDTQVGDVVEIRF